MCCGVMFLISCCQCKIILWTHLQLHYAHTEESTPVLAKLPQDILVAPNSDVAHISHFNPSTYYWFCSTWHKLICVWGPVIDRFCCAEQRSTSFLTSHIHFSARPITQTTHTLFLEYSQVPPTAGRPSNQSEQLGGECLHGWKRDRNKDNTQF